MAGAWAGNVQYELNKAAELICQRMVTQAEALRVRVRSAAGEATVIDCGIEARGGLEAGRLLAEVCMAGLGRVEFVPGSAELWSGPAVMVRTDAPVAACMAAQYAGWKVQHEKFFAMGSGPMRAATGKEELFDKIGFRERPEVAVGVLETRQSPPDEVLQSLAEACGVDVERLTILVAPTASQAGTVQIAARSVETALHKLLELGFDLGRIESGFGMAPLPPVARDDLAAIGRTNDAILYGAEVTLWVRGDDDSLRTIGPKTPSSASAEFGAPFIEIFKRYDGDFYKIDPLLFSPAVVTFVNLDTGNSFRFGHTLPRVIHRSFAE
ncbi:MAG TPA: methenyltetrahydromethanopterin cyclohydrolase [Pirellulales bacterium]|nr:methenyltetrahydromethanopterin cyclohydrolase [Pirellulales bacterium]